MHTYTIKTSLLLHLGHNEMDAILQMTDFKKVSFDQNVMGPGGTVDK